jgi:hypothetical protein
MLYLVSGKLRNQAMMQLPHDEFVKLMRNTVFASLEELLKLQKAGEIVGGGIPAGSQDVVFILNLATASSHLAVRHRLFRLPLFNHYSWEVTPLETLEEWLSMMKG